VKDRLDVIVLMSGGMDSCVTGTLAVREAKRVGALHVSYGQRTASRERRAFQEITDTLGIADRLVTDIDYLRQIGGSSLTDPEIAVTTADLEAQEVPSSYVPFRNTHLLSIATSWAEVTGARKIYVGAVEEDSSGYPDCRRTYFDEFERLVAVGSTMSDLRVVTPLIALSKADIVRLGLEIGSPLDLSWSCYRSEDVACGVCDSCALRLRGFARAGTADPVEYSRRPEYG